MGPPDLQLRIAPLDVGVEPYGDEPWAGRCWLCVEVMNNLGGAGRELG